MTSDFTWDYWQPVSTYDSEFSWSVSQDPTYTWLWSSITYYEEEEDEAN